MLDIVIVIGVALAAAAIVAMLGLIRKSRHTTGWILAAVAVAAGAFASFQARSESMLVQALVIVAWSLTLASAVRLRPYFTSLDLARRELNDERARATKLVEVAPAMIATFDRELQLRGANDAFCALFGMTEAEMLAIDWSDPEAIASATGTPADEWSARFSFVQAAAVCESAGLGVDTMHDTGDGRRVVSWRCAALSGADGATWEILLVGHDITDAVEAQREAGLHFYLLDQTVDGIALIDLPGRVQYANAAFARLLGRESVEPGLDRTAWLDFTDEEAVAHIETLVGGGVVETDVLRLDGTRVAAELQMRVIGTGDERRGVVTARDLTEHRAVAEQLKRAATHDPLTGLPNRFGFLLGAGVATAHAAATGEQVGLLFLDIDRFGAVNDSFGCDVGDGVLVALARRLSDMVPPTADVGRTGEDEFGMLVTDIASEAELFPLAERLLEAVKAPLIVGTIEVNITASIGVSFSAFYDHNAEDMLLSAMKAQTIARSEGGDAYATQRSFPVHESRERYAIKTDLRYALDRGELAVHYQPVVDARDGRMVGAEALLRWHHPTRGAINPGLAVELAEEAGLITDIDAWVMRTACGDCGTWRAMGYGDFVVSVNVSGREFADKGFADSVEAALDAHGLDGSALELEVSERIVMRDSDPISETFEQLSAMGIAVAIDDFGTGHSSLARLKRLPVQTLKVDRSFVQDICTDEDSAAIATSVITLAHALNMRVIAEGVETAPQLEFLRAHGCDLIQGFLFSAAVPARDLGLLLLAR
jgi:diguanylate cyclase (GGDEF)-like protein/PAS domain S-box-containing protein